MREKITRFSKGNFEYELPIIALSDEEIDLTVEAGTRKEGTFTISNSNQCIMHGWVYSSNVLMELEQPEFCDSSVIIRYMFNAQALKAGDEVHGKFCIVCDIGEVVLYFTIHVEAPYCLSSMGKIKDLFQFTNLARTDWSEAKKVFRSEDFEPIFLANEDRYRVIYRNLVKSISTSQALEEFLVTIHKKSQIVLEIDKENIEYTIKENNISDKITLTKNQWGYAEIKVSTDASFIQLDQKFVWADHFIGNSHQISYTIDPTLLNHGNNYGHILIRTAHQTITVTILCNCQITDHRLSPIRFKQKVEASLLDTYLSFRLNRISLEEYLDDTELLINKLPGPEISYIKDLMRTHLAIISGRTYLAEELLSDFAKEETVLKRKSILEYAAYLYLEALYYKEDAKIKRASEIIWKLYSGGHFDWRLLWFLLYTDKSFENNKSSKLAHIKEQYDAGCRSPIMYYEAICIFNEEPFLLRELTEFEIQALNFGIRNWILSKEAAKQYTYAAAKSKSYNPVIFNCLVKLYDEYDDPDILSAICSILIKGMKRSEKYFDWYRLGVEAQLRITELYEYYMHSISISVEDALAQPVLLYFIYNSNLSDGKKAFLYANVVKNKANNEPIYRSYYKKMEVFALKMLETHHISKDLAVLYREFLNKNLYDANVWQQLPYVLFRHELECKNPDIVSVLLVQKEIGTIATVPLVDQKAQIDIATDNSELIFVDSFGNRFGETVQYTLTPLMEISEYASICIPHIDHPLLLLYFFDRYHKNRIINKDAIALIEKVLLLEGLEKEYLNSCYQTLIEYYYENYDDEALDYYINQIDLQYVRVNERVRYIELMIVRGLYQKALYHLEIFGLEGIALNRLVKLCSGYLKAFGIEHKDYFIVNLCYYVFCEGKYDDVILQYMITYYTGSTNCMYRLWQAAKSFELNCRDLEERLITQILYSESYVGDCYQIFESYYKEVSNRTLVRAFLSYYAYQYLVHEQVINSNLFPIMKRELFYEQNDVCLLAWLKYHASKTILAEQEKLFVEYNLNQLVKKDILLPFFLDFKDRVNLPDEILDRYIVAYHTNPRKRVFIHYCLDNKKDNQYMTETLQDTFMGIHTKVFTLFYHETLQYYITEESEEETGITESLNVQFECDNPEEIESNYNHINLMLMALEMKDDKTLLDMMKSYTKNEYMISKCFKQLEE